MSEAVPLVAVTVGIGCLLIGIIIGYVLRGVVEDGDE